MTSDRQILSNRENALKSTGPRTPEGKEVSKRNAVKHGIYSNDLILRHGLIKEDPDAFERLFENLKQDLHAQGTLEEMLVEKIAVSWWRLARIYRAELAQFHTEIDVLKQSFAQPGFLNTLLATPSGPTPEDDSDSVVSHIAILLNMSPADLAQQEEFRDLLKEKCLGRTIEELSVHQRKRLVTRLRQQLITQLTERRRTLAYQRLTLPKQVALLVPNERLGSELTRLERSIERDLRILFDLQERRAGKHSGFVAEK